VRSVFNFSSVLPGSLHRFAWKLKDVIITGTDLAWFARPLHVDSLLDGWRSQRLYIVEVFKIAQNFQRRLWSRTCAIQASGSHAFITQVFKTSSGP